MKNLIRFVPAAVNKAPLRGISTVAVREITVSGTYTINDKVFETILIEALVRDAGLIMAERQALSLLLEEQKLSLTGLTAEEESKVGKLTGVDGLLSVSIDIPRKNRMNASLTLTDTERGAVVWRQEFTGEYYTPLKLAIGPTFRFPVG